MKLASLAFALLIELIYIYIYIYLIWTTTHAFPFRERLVPPLANNRPTLLSSPLSSLPRDRDWNVKFWGDTRTTSSTPKKERFNIRGYVTRLATLESGLLFGTRNGQNCFHDFHVITPPWFTKNGKRRMVWKFRAAESRLLLSHGTYIPLIPDLSRRLKLARVHRPIPVNYTYGSLWSPSSSSFSFDRCRD